MKYIDSLTLENKRVFIRCDLDVPLNEDLQIADDTRLQAALETIAYASQANARVIVAGHLGRPKGTKNEKFSLRHVAERLSTLLSQPVGFVDDCVGSKVIAAVERMNIGETVLLENLRFYAGEESNDPQFAASLSNFCDVYINNAFATSHRSHASTVGMVELVPEAAAGFTIKRELEYFEKALEAPARPLVAIFGGAKISTKLKAIKNVIQHADAVIVGGAMANTFFLAQGHSIGTSLFEADQLEVAKEILATANSGTGRKLLLPVDVIVASDLAPGAQADAVSVDSIPDSKKALDIGPKSLELFTEALGSAKTILWNGPMGVFEIPEFSSGTYGIIDALVRSEALTVVGGGDTDLALHQRHAMDKMDFVSTAGGAFLTLLEGSKLDAVEALRRKNG